MSSSLLLKLSQNDRIYEKDESFLLSWVFLSNDMLGLRIDRSTKQSMIRAQNNTSCVQMNLPIIDTAQPIDFMYLHRIKVQQFTV